MAGALLTLLGGLAGLVWSADRFVEVAAATARRLGLSPLLTGTLVVGFGTSAPEMLVSTLSGVQGQPGISLGNAYGSNIVNIGLILGLSALLAPIQVESVSLRREMPVLLTVTGLAAWQIGDTQLSRADAAVLLILFATLVTGAVLQARDEYDAGAPADAPAAIWWLPGTLLLLLVSSQLLVWGAVRTASLLGIGELVIGLTAVAVGTSLPELAASLAAIRRGRHQLALGNVLGSNIFNTLAVVGIAAIIQPLPVDPAVLRRDVPVMGALTVILVLFCYSFRGPGRISRIKAVLLLSSYLAYNVLLVTSASGDNPDGVNNAGDVAQQGEQYVDPKLRPDTHLEENAQWREKDGEHNAN